MKVHLIHILEQKFYFTLEKQKMNYLLLPFNQEGLIMSMGYCCSLQFYLSLIALVNSCVLDVVACS